ncbi:general transcription factor 3C polypeptide 2 isoform X2 [Chelonia mydas]|uniref:general transcription factor 3C polypeptide 2 isoform X2 n=1 Tax=Chelonia mydas TaxID=8469 RepID=UPI0018A23399|nr:general transcription factor 3C polypeptide 2 isoform X2 [Chelonia mydas]
MAARAGAMGAAAAAAGPRGSLRSEPPCAAEAAAGPSAPGALREEPGRRRRRTRGRGSPGSERPEPSSPQADARELPALVGWEVSAHPEGELAAAMPRRKPVRSRKSKRKRPARKCPAWAEAEGGGEAAGTSENGPTLPMKVPKKRGRKSKAELLLLKLSQGLDCQAPEPICVQKVLGSNEAPDGLEATPSGRPKRRAAKVALLYLQELAEELTSVYQPLAPNEGPQEPESDGSRKKRRSRRRKEEEADDDDLSQDVDFVPSEEVLLEAAEEEEESDVLLSEVSESEPEAVRGHTLRMQSAGKSKPQCRGLAPNGFHNSIMAPVWKCPSITHSLRDQHYSPWEFPDWLPSTRKWTFLSESECAQYLPGEMKSPLFSIQREGIEEDGVLYRINRFNSLQPHEERLDVSFFVGGPVWAMEWCPCPEGSAAPQYVALYCNKGMDERHSLAELHTGPALLQLWALGILQPEAGSATKARLAYAITADHGCIWDMKFCPSGAWELPTTCRKPPQMSRLGLLAAAFSDGKVLVYSLPHPEGLLAHKRAQVKGGPFPKHTICKVQCIATLQVGSIQAGNSSECGQCFSLSWMPSKPHQHLAAGFYDGTVAIWNLPTKSLLQRVRQPDGSLKIYPFRCFLAHDHAVRSIEWCKVNSNFLVTAGNDRKIKFWDLRRLYEPINSIKRFLTTEITWLLPYNGVTVAQDNCYASYGLCGIHYIDAGYLGFKAYFVAPRKGTVWSISSSDWLNAVAAGDITGELLAAVLPDLAMNPLNIKRPSERRFPIYKADLVPCSSAGGEEPRPKTRTYSEMTKDHCLRFQDTDLRSFQNFFSREPTRRMHEQEVKAELSLDRMQLESIHKVRFSPNLDSHGWLVSGGQSGIVRAHCLVGLTSPVGHKLLQECRAQFSAMYRDRPESPSPAEHGLLQEQ